MSLSTHLQAFSTHSNNEVIQKISENYQLFDVFTRINQTDFQDVLNNLLIISTVLGSTFSLKLPNFSSIIIYLMKMKSKIGLVK